MAAFAVWSIDWIYQGAYQGDSPEEVINRLNAWKNKNLRHVIVQEFNEFAQQRNITNPKQLIKQLTNQFPY